MIFRTMRFILCVIVICNFCVLILSFVHHGNIDAGNDQKMFPTRPDIVRAEIFGDLPMKCFKQESKIFGFYFLPMEWDLAKYFCRIVHHSELYNPRKKETLDLIMAYKCWSKDPSHLAKFWTNWEICSLLKTNQRALFTIVFNEIKLGRWDFKSVQNKMKTCAAIHMDTSEEHLQITLGITSRETRLPFICQLKNKEGCKEIIEMRHSKEEIGEFPTISTENDFKEKLIDKKNLKNKICNKISKDTDGNSKLYTIVVEDSQTEIPNKIYEDLSTISDNRITPNTDKIVKEHPSTIINTKINSNTDSTITFDSSTAASIIVNSNTDSTFKDNPLPTETIEFTTNTNDITLTNDSTTPENLKGISNEEETTASDDSSITKNIEITSNKKDRTSADNCSTAENMTGSFNNDTFVADDLSTIENVKIIPKKEYTTVLKDLLTIENMKDTSNTRETAAASISSTIENIKITSHEEDTITSNDNLTTGNMKESTNEKDTTVTNSQSTTENMKVTSNKESRVTDHPSTTENVTITSNNEAISASNDSSITKNLEITSIKEDTTAADDSSTVENMKSTSNKEDSTVAVNCSTTENMKSTSNEEDTTVPEDPSTIENIIITSNNEETTATNDSSIIINLEITSIKEDTTAADNSSTAENMKSTSNKEDSTVTGNSSTTENMKSTSNEQDTTVPEDPSTIENISITSNIEETTATNDSSIIINLETTSIKEDTTAADNSSTAENMRSTSNKEDSTVTGNSSTTENMKSTLNEEDTTVADDHSAIGNMKELANEMHTTVANGNMKGCTNKTPTTVTGRPSTTENVESSSNKENSTITDSNSSTTENTKVTSNEKDTTSINESITFFVTTENFTLFDNETYPEDTSLKNEVTENNPHVTTRSPYCKKSIVGEVHFPQTRRGSIAKANCPKGQYGIASLKCDINTGSFTGEPFADCKPINCSIHENVSEDERHSYMAERLITCKDKKAKPEEQVMDLMNQIRKERIEIPESGKKGEFDSPNEYREVIANHALRIYDRLLESDVTIWEKLSEEQRMNISMDIIKETEETAWLVGCGDDFTGTSNMKKQNLAMEIISLATTNEVTFDLNDNYLIDFAKLPTNSLPSTKCGPQKVRMAVAAIFKNIQKHLEPKDCKYSITSNILGVSLGAENTTFDKERIEILLHHPRKPDGAVPKCVFLNGSNESKTRPYGVWDSSGCEVEESGENYTICKCSHLTNFAILMDFTESKFSDEDTKLLSLISLTCSSISVVALVLTIIIYMTIRSLRNRRNTITCNLAVCLLCMNILIQTGLQKHCETACYVISALLQYTVLSSFLWMLLEGVLLYKMVILVFETTRIRLPVLYAIAYGIPLVIVAIAFTTRREMMIRQSYCWPSSEKGAIWSIVGPIALVIMVNIIIFAMTMNAAVRMDRMNFGNKSIKERKKALKMRLKGALSLTCLLGFTWLVGFFHMPQYPAATAYLFVVLNGLQGVFLFMTQMILNNHVRNKLFVIYKENLARFTSKTSSWNTFLNPNKQQPNIVVTAQDNTVIFSDVCPTKFHIKSIYPTAPSPESEKESSKISELDEDLHHPFEINYDI